MELEKGKIIFQKNIYFWYIQYCCILNNIYLHSETNLIKNLRKGSPFAFEEIFSKYSNKLYHFSLSYLKSESDAEEIVQEVFMKLWEKRETLKTETSFKSYLFTITLNLIKKRFRQKAKEDKYKHDFLAQISEKDDRTESALTYQDLLNMLEVLIQKLPEKRRQIFIERKQHGKPVKQIAEEMDISPKTVENQLTRALNHLKTELQKDHFGGLIFFHLFILS